MKEEALKALHGLSRRDLTIYFYFQSFNLSSLLYFIFKKREREREKEREKGREKKRREEATRESVFLKYNLLFTTNLTIQL